MSRDTPNAVAVSNTKLAACMAALGFPWKVEPIQHGGSGRLITQFMFSGCSVRPQFARYDAAIARQHDSGALQQREPMHPLCVMMRAQRNYDRLLDAQKGTPIRLKSTAGGQMTGYAPGPENQMFQDPKLELVETDDLALAAALGGVGLPVIRIEGAAPRRRYILPRVGYVTLRADGTQKLEDARVLAARAPTAQDPLRLAIEVADALHPVTLSYDALHARAILKSLLGKTTPLLLLQDGGLQALVSMNASGRVMDRATAHFKAPPVRW